MAGPLAPSSNQKNQNYVVEVSTVKGGAAFSNIATVAYLPFDVDGTLEGSSRVNVTGQASGILASGVDQIRFTYTVPAGNEAQPSPTIREIDVFGSATTTETASSSPPTSPAPVTRHVAQRDVAICFIGDSITQSNADGDGNGSPRKSLYNLLDRDGASFTYTGHFAANVDGLPKTGGAIETNLYHYHSGVSSIRIGEVGGARGFASNMTKYWNSGRLAVVKPDQILIMLGTNDVATPVGATDRLRRLIEEIYELPNVGSPTIFLASIQPNGRNASDTTY